MRRIAVARKRKYGRVNFLHMTTAAQNATPATTRLLNKLAAETGMNKRRIVLLSLYAFSNLKDEQRKQLNTKHNAEIAVGGGQ